MPSHILPRSSFMTAGYESGRAITSVSTGSAPSCGSDRNAAANSTSISTHKPDRWHVPSLHTLWNKIFYKGILHCLLHIYQPSEFIATDRSYTRNFAISHISHFLTSAKRIRLYILISEDASSIPRERQLFSSFVSSHLLFILIF